MSVQIDEGVDGWIVCLCVRCSLSPYLQIVVGGQVVIHMLTKCLKLKISCNLHTAVVLITCTMVVYITLGNSTAVLLKEWACFDS